MPEVWVPCPHSQAGENPETGQASATVGLDGHLWAWMGTLAKPSLRGREQSWVCSGSLLDLGSHLAAWASPGWVSAQGQGHHEGCGQHPVLVTDWDGNTSGCPSAMGCGLSPCICLPAPPHPDVNGLMQIKSSHLNPQKKSPCCASRDHSHCMKCNSRVPGGISGTAQWQQGGLGCSQSRGVKLSLCSRVLQQVLRLLRSRSGSPSATISQQQSRFSSDCWFSRPTLGGNKSPAPTCPAPLPYF